LSGTRWVAGRATARERRADRRLRRGHRSGPHHRRQHRL